MWAFLVVVAASTGAPVVVSKTETIGPGDVVLQADEIRNLHKELANSLDTIAMLTDLLHKERENAGYYDDQNSKQATGKAPGLWDNVNEIYKALYENDTLWANWWKDWEEDTQDEDDWWKDWEEDTQDDDDWWVSLEEYTQEDILHDSNDTLWENREKDIQDDDT